MQRQKHNWNWSVKHFILRIRFSKISLFRMVLKRSKFTNFWWCGTNIFLHTSMLSVGRGAGSDSVTRVNDSTRVTIFGDPDSTRVTLRKMVTRLESRFSQNDSTRVAINDSRLESELFLQNLRASDWQTQFVCIQRNDHFLVQ